MPARFLYVRVPCVCSCVCVCLLPPSPVSDGRHTHTHTFSPRAHYARAHTQRSHRGGTKTTGAAQSNERRTRNTRTCTVAISRARHSCEECSRSLCVCACVCLWIKNNATQLKIRLMFGDSARAPARRIICGIQTSGAYARSCPFARTRTRTPTDPVGTRRHVVIFEHAVARAGRTNRCQTI